MKITKKIKVLFLVGNLRPANGVSSFAMTYFRNIDHNKISIDFALLNDVKSPYYKEIRQNGGRIFILPPLHKTFQHIRACYKILRSNNYQIIHNNLLLSSIPMIYCAWLCKVPVRILQSHNTELSSIKWKEKRNKTFLPILKCVSNAYLACGIEAGKALFGNNDFNVIPNAIPFNKTFYDPIIRKDLRKKYNCKNKIVIGTVGRISFQKNPFFALDVIEKAYKKNPNIEYWWIGSGELDEKVKNYVQKKGLNKFVRFFGSRTDVQKLYQAMDVFFLPSLFEGLPITAIEAQASGLPSLISSSVTRELEYTDLVKFLSLNSSLDTWAENLISQSERNPVRQNYINDLRSSEFYAPNAANKLSLNYMRFLKFKDGK